MDVQPTYARDLTVLQAIYKALETADQVSTPQIMNATSLDRDAVWDAVDLWMKEECLDHKVARTTGSSVTVFRMNRTPKGMRLVGAWPAPDVLASQLVEALQALAEQEPDPEKKRSLGELVKQLRPRHLVDIARAIQILMDTGVLPHVG